MSSRWYLYMLRCRDDSLYTGITMDVSRRLAEHQRNEGKEAKYLRGKGPFRLVFEKAIGSRGVALRVEGRIKRLPKRRKEVLIQRDDMIRRMVAQARKKSDARRATK